MTSTKYGPKGPLSPTLGTPCTICGAPLEVGDYTTFHRAASALRFCDDSPEVHWDCEHLRAARVRTTTE